MPEIEIGRGLRLAVSDSGSGPAVVFLHGLAGCKEWWEETAAAVRACGYRTIACDQRGHGESADLPGTIADMAGDVARLLNRLEIETACVVGHSMGGRVAFQFAVDWPQRLSALVVVGAHSEAPRAPYDAILRQVRDATARGGIGAFRAAFAAAGEIPNRATADAVYAARFDAWFARNRTASLVDALNAILAMFPLTPRLGEIRVPTLAVVGEYDTHFLDLASYYEKAIPACRTVIVPGCAHYPMIDRPADFNQAVTAFFHAGLSPSSAMARNKCAQVTEDQ